MQPIPMPIPPLSNQTAGCWSNFVSGAGKVVNWCGRQVTTAVTAVSDLVQNVVKAAANFFRKTAFFCAFVSTSVTTFIKTHAVVLAAGSLALGAGVIGGLVLNRFFGCCNKLDDEAEPDDVVIIPDGLESSSSEINRPDVQDAQPN